MNTGLILLILSSYFLPSAISTSNYDAANHQLIFGSYNLLYDANGNVTNIINGTVTNQLVWNARNQLTNMLGAITANFLYDGLGRRITRTVSSATEKYLYDGSDIIQQLNNSGTTAATYFRGLAVDEPWQRLDFGGVTLTNRVYLADGLGSIIALTDTNKAISTQYFYDPFGGTTNTGTGNKNSYQFTGRENDATGLYYYRARYYHPALGRFISEDPLGMMAGDVNVYVYGRNSSLNLIDPSGMDPNGLENALIGLPFNIIAGVYQAAGYLGAVAGVGEIADAAMGAVLGDIEAEIGSAELGAAEENGVVAEEENALSPYSYTQPGDTFYHYGYADQAGNFAGGLNPNAFATSAGDLSGAEAQSGLALRYATPPDSVYSVSPEPGTLFRVNPVTSPNFGQPGGLPEYQFPLGTGPGTVSGPTLIH